MQYILNITISKMELKAPSFVVVLRSPRNIRRRP